MNEEFKRNLWGEIENVSTIPMPITILREQASILGELTNDVLKGEVSYLTKENPDTHGESIAYKMSIIAPFLDNYRCDILRVKQPFEVYPLSVNPLLEDFSNRSWSCQNEETFIDVIGKILQSDGVRKVISVLMSHANK